MKKKLLCVIVLILALVCAFVSCDSSDSSSPETSKNTTHTHSYDEWEIKQSATCTTVGSRERYCSCGEKQTESISAKGHSFGSWSVVKKATQTEKGSEERVCSCGEKETRDIDIISLVTTVTKNEWKKAFDFSTTRSFSVEFDELCTDDKVFGVNGTLTVQNETVYTDIVHIWNNEEDRYQEYKTGLINKFFDIGDYVGEWFCEFGFEIEDLADYGFSLFEYSEISKSYVAKFELDGILCDVNFSFENKQITKITILGHDNETSLNCTYIFSYN